MYTFYIRSLAHARALPPARKNVVVVVVVSGGSSRGAQSIHSYARPANPAGPLVYLAKPACAPPPPNGRPRMGWCESFRHVGQVYIRDAVIFCPRSRVFRKPHRTAAVASARSCTPVAHHRAPYALSSVITVTAVCRTSPQDASTTMALVASSPPQPLNALSTTRARGRPPPPPPPPPQK